MLDTLMLFGSFAHHPGLLMNHSSIVGSSSMGVSTRQELSIHWSFSVKDTIGLYLVLRSSYQPISSY